MFLPGKVNRVTITAAAETARTTLQAMTVAVVVMELMIHQVMTAAAAAAETARTIRRAMTTVVNPVVVASTTVRATTAAGIAAGGAAEVGDRTGMRGPGQS